MSKDILEGCPFCGSHGFVERDEARIIYGEAKPYSVECNACRGTVGYFSTEDRAIKNWNIRTFEEEEIKAENKRLREALEAIQLSAEIISQNGIREEVMKFTLERISIHSKQALLQQPDGQEGPNNEKL